MRLYQAVLPILFVFVLKLIGFGCFKQKQTQQKSVRFTVGNDFIADNRLLRLCIVALRKNFLSKMGAKNNGVVQSRIEGSEVPRKL